MPGRVVAVGGLSPEHDDAALHAYIRASAKRPRPRVCFIPLASGDDERYVELFYEQYPTTDCEPTHLELVRAVPRRPAEVLSQQDVVYVGGGSTPILVAALRVHGLVSVLRNVWSNGAVLCGHSAGAHVWFQGCITDSLGPDLQPFPDGLGFLSGSCVAHYDDTRAELTVTALRAGVLRGPAWGIPDGTALAFDGGGAVECVTSRASRDVARHEVVDGHARVTPIRARGI